MAETPSPDLSDDASTDADATDSSTADTKETTEKKDRSSGERSHRPGRGWRAALLSVLAVFLVLTLATGGIALWVRHSLSSNLETIGDPFSAIPTRANLTDRKSVV